MSLSIFAADGDLRRYCGGCVGVMAVVVAQNGGGGDCQSTCYLV